MDPKIKRIARAGYAAKGAVYILTGILALLTAFDLGGEKVGKLQILDFLEKQTFGKVLLALIGIGLICYAVWRFIQSVRDPEGIGSDKRALVKRSGFFISGVLYLGLGLLALVEIFREVGSSGNQAFLSGEKGKYMLLLAGAIFVLKALYQFAVAIKGDFMQNLDLRSIRKDNVRSIVKKVGYAGFIARGIVEGVIGYILIMTGLRELPKDIKGTSQAFTLLQQTSNGPWLLGLVAAGLVCYGLYVLSFSRYRNFKR